MGFVVEAKKEFGEERAVRGHYKKVAVGCWFTSTGRGIPQLVKYEDEEGCIRTLSNIQVFKTDQKNYAGIRTQRFDCSAIVDGREQLFTLLYHLENNLWDLVLPEI